MNKKLVIGIVAVVALAGAAFYFSGTGGGLLKGQIQNCDSLATQFAAKAVPFNNATQYNVAKLAFDAWYNLFYIKSSALKQCPQLNATLNNEYSKMKVKLEALKDKAIAEETAKMKAKGAAKEAEKAAAQAAAKALADAENE